jgi:hypothetical protein
MLRTLVVDEKAAGTRLGDGFSAYILFTIHIDNVVLVSVRLVRAASLNQAAQRRFDLLNEVTSDPSSLQDGLYLPGNQTLRVWLISDVPPAHSFRRGIL